MVMPESALKNEYILEVQHVAKSFGKLNVLKDVSFGIRQGEIVGIVGENGAGKSTLLKILVGLLSPTDGEVVTIKGKMGYCPQELLTFETLTVRENFCYFAAAYGLNEWQETKDDLLDRFRFRQYEDMLVSKLSSGTKQKLNLAIALLHLPDVLILDEPYSGFDWETYLHFWDFTGELKLKKKSILIISHLVYDQSKFDTLFELKSGVLKCV